MLRCTLLSFLTCCSIANVSAIQAVPPQDFKSKMSANFGVNGEVSTIGDVISHVGNATGHVFVEMDANGAINANTGEANDFGMVSKAGRVVEQAVVSDAVALASANISAMTPTTTATRKVESNDFVVIRTPRQNSTQDGARKTLMTWKRGKQGVACKRDSTARRRSGKSCRVLAGLQPGAIGHSGTRAHSRAINVCRANTTLGEEARATCCKTCATAPFKIIFGGPLRAAGDRGRLRLPEEVRAQQCTLGKCQECGKSGKKANCFFGKTLEGYRPVLTLSVQPGLSFTSYRASAYAKCDVGDSAQFDVTIRAMQNGIVKVFLDGTLKKTLTRIEETWNGAYTGGDAFQFLVEFFPIKRVTSSSLIVKVAMTNIRPQFEQCMEYNTCLKAMGDMRNNASYALRNKNGYQLACLRRATLPLFLASTCVAWRSCVEQQPALAKYLLTSLSAANPSMLQVETTSVAEEKNRGEVSHRQQDECLDPATADAEALECECMVWFQEKCADDEECFKSEYCKHQGVCPDWKTANGCPQHLLQAESKGQDDAENLARRNSANGSNIGGVERKDQQTSILQRSDGRTSRSSDGLDASLGGKCAETARF